MKQITGTDVARAANVSQSTVSRVMSGDSRIGAETRRRVLEAARTLNYDMGRSTNWTIGVLLDFRLCDIHGYYASTLHAVLEELEKRKLGVELIWRGLDSDQVVKPFRGVLAISAPDLDKLRSFAPLPTVLLHGEMHQGENIASVTTDMYQGMHDAVRHLWKLGHRDIRLVSLEGKASEERKLTRRLDGFLSALAERGVPAPERHTIFFEEQMATSLPLLARAIRNAMREGCTALICVNAAHTLKLNAALHALRLHIPEELSIVDWEYPEISAYLDPPRTTVSANFPELVHVAVDLLCEMVEHQALPKLVKVPPLLIRRKSTGRAPHPRQLMR